MRADEARIESPCEEDEDRMRLEPGGLRRYCERCSKAVHDLSAMGPERARALLAGATGSICISYVMDHDGELVFDAPRFVPLARLAQAATLAASLTACAPHGDEAPMRIEDSAVRIDTLETPTPVVIPSRPPQPPKPAEPAIEEPCEPEVVPRPPKRPNELVKGRLVKTRGAYAGVIDGDDPLGPL